MSETDQPPPCLIAPPLPAPYLAGAPSLPDDLLGMMRPPRKPTAAQHRRIQLALVQCRDRVRIAREDFEAAHNVKIEPEGEPTL